MEAHRIFQFSASVAATICSGGGHALWLGSMALGNTWRLPSLNQKVILCQVGVGLLIFVGSIVSLVLAVHEPIYRKDNSRPILKLVVGFTLVLQTANEYLSVSTLHSRLIGYFAISVTFWKVLVILLFFVNGISPRNRHILYSMGMVVTSSELFFLCSQYIRLWVSCVRSSNETCSSELPRTHRVLLVASVTSAMLSAASTTLTIAAYVRQDLSIQFSTLQVAILGIMRMVISLYKLKGGVSKHGLAPNSA